MEWYWLADGMRHQSLAMGGGLEGDSTEAKKWTDPSFVVLIAAGMGYGWANGLTMWLDFAFTHFKLVKMYHSEASLAV